jgi:hypothetical protein
MRNVNGLCIWHLKIENLVPYRDVVDIIPCCCLSVSFRECGEGRSRRPLNALISRRCSPEFRSNKYLLLFQQSADHNISRFKPLSLRERLIVSVLRLV